MPELRKYYNRYRMLTVFDQGTRLFIFWSGALLLFILLALANFPEPVRHGVLALFWITQFGLLFTFIYRIHRLTELRTFCKFLSSQSELFADLLNTTELLECRLRDGISEDLRDSLVSSMRDRLDRQSPSEWLRSSSFRPQLKNAFLMGLVATCLWIFPPYLMQSGWNHLFYGTEKELFKYLKITPQGGPVLLGETVRVTVELIRNSFSKPELAVQNESGWERINGQVEGKKSNFDLKSITRPTRYRVHWKGLRSSPYLLVPVEPPKLSDFKTEIILPSYLGLKPQIVTGQPQLRVYRGSRLTISARSSKELESIEMIASSGISYPTELSRERDIKVSFMVRNPLEFYFKMKDKHDTITPKPVRYSISIQEDLRPQVQILAPSDDLFVGKESEIPLTYELKDDLGIQALYLRIIREKPVLEKKVLLRKYRPVVTEKIDSARFSLGSLRVHSGEILKMRLEASDNDLVTGPKSGFSDWILVEVQSYEKEHEQIEEELEAFREELIELLADQTLAAVSGEDWIKVSERPHELAQKANETMDNQSDIISRTKAIENKIKETLSKMERDPLSDFSLWSEHRAIRKGLESLRNGAMNRAMENLSSKDFQSAAEEQESAVSELERLSNLSEEVYKYGKMKDLIHHADRLLSKGEKLNQKLDSGGSLDPEMAEFLQETLREAFKIISEMQKQISQLPQELPEDFINKPAVKQMDLNRIADSMKKLSQSLSNGDLQSAIQAAQELLKQAKEARDLLSKASEDIALSGGEDLPQNMKEKSIAIEKMIERQEKLLEQTRQLDLKRKEFLLNWQKELLGRLGTRQKKVMQETQIILKTLRENRTLFPPGRKVNDSIRAAYPKIGKVLKEFEQENVLFSQKWLDQIVQGIGPGIQEVVRWNSVDKSTPVFDDKTWSQIQWLESEERSILDHLKSPPESKQSPFNDQDRSKLKSLSREENKLAGETGQLRDELSEWSSKSAIMDSQMMDSLKSAYQEMKKAGQLLQKSDSQSAQARQQKALSHLRKTQEQMESVQNQFSNMKQMGGGKPSGFVQPRNRSGGRDGFKTGTVRIPGADEYLPPSEFREEILEALRENYPKSQEGIIKEYYKRLTQ